MAQKRKFSSCALATQFFSFKDNKISVSYHFLYSLYKMPLKAIKFHHFFFFLHNYKSILYLTVFHLIVYGNPSIAVYRFLFFLVT